MRKSKVGGRGWRVGWCGALAVAVLAGVASRSAADGAGSPCGVVERARIVVKNAGEPIGDEELIFTGRLAFTAGALTDRLFDGAHVSIEVVGSAEPMFELNVGSMPASRRARGALRARAGDGARAVLRIIDRRPRHDEVAFRLTAKGVAINHRLGALRAQIALGPTGAGNADEQCGAAAMFASDCRTDATGSMVSCRANTEPVPASHCQVSGCSSEVCADQPMLTACEWRPQYACYAGERCEDQGNGVCGWTPSEDLARCLAETGSPTPTPGPLEMSIPPAWQACSASDECAVVTGLGCCGCDAGGGPEAALNQAHVEDFAALRAEHCSDVLCPGEFLCRDGLRAVCRQNACTVR